MEEKKKVEFMLAMVSLYPKLSFLLTFYILRHSSEYLKQFCTIFHKKEKSKTPAKTSEEMDLQRARENEQRLKLEIGRLKKEIDRVHRTWEKKFAILQQR